MAFSFPANSLNQFPTTGSEHVFNIKEKLKVWGWMVLSSSDGTTYNSSGDQISSAGTGANGMANTNAWFRIQSPAGGREFLWQRGTSNIAWREYYSAGAGFTGGTPSATVLPTATDQQQVIGTAGATATAFGTDATYYADYIIDNASPYSFIAITRTVGTGAVRSVHGLDGMLDVSGDTDPVIILAANAESDAWSAATNNFFAQTGTLGSTAACVGWWRKGGSGATFVDYGGCIVGSSDGELMTSFGTNPYSGNMDTFPVWFGRVGTAPLAYKGRSSIFRCNSSHFSKGDLNQDKSRAVFGIINLPWDSVTTPII